MLTDLEKKVIASIQGDIPIVSRPYQVLAVAIIIMAIVVATVRFAYHSMVRAPGNLFRSYKISLGRALLLGLEILVAADVVRTVALDATLQAVLTLGLLVLIIGAMFSVAGRRESLVYMGKGDEIRLNGEYTVRLVDFEYQEYEDGRPKDWISTVEVRRDGELLHPSFAIEVNKPLRIGGVRIYQSSFGREDRALLRDADGITRPIASSQGFEMEGAVVVFRGIEGAAAVFERWEQHTRTAIYRSGIGETIGEYTITRLDSREVTGLKAVKDPGFIPVVIALIIVAAGLTLTLIQKGKDKDI